MSTLLVLTVFALVLYWGSAVVRTEMGSTIKATIVEDMRRLRALLGQGQGVAPAPRPTDHLFGNPRRTQPPSTPHRHAARPPVGPPSGRSPSGGRRVNNPNAPCWVCGQPNTPGHRH